MKKQFLTGLLLSGLLIFAVFQNAVSSHLMGGNLGYEYLGVNANGLYQYRITITIYRYCEPGSSNLPTTMNLGVYRDNPTNPTGNKQLITTSSIPLISITPITPPNGNDTCTFTPSVCVEEGIYQGIVTLASNTTGYYFISDRCCRNNNIANLNNPGNTGQAYYAYAPPPATVNSSPTFAVAPVPFLCASDTVSILNQAYDPDGDLLVYSFVTPYQGISSNNQPNPNPPANYTWPIPNINYAPGYSQANPFGAGGFTSIDTLTGLASYYAPNIGFYVLAVEIREYRNGVLIGVSRRDLQIIVIACPVNPAPVLTSGSQTSFIINEGQTLCFNSIFSDSNGDSLFLSHTGDIFNPAITNPPATFTDNSGSGTVSGTFCWTPSCEQGRPTPYQFSVSVTDNGCPAKITNVVYSITVVNTPAPVSMTGPDTVCFSPGIAYTYTVPNSLGNSFSWTTTNANIAGNPTGTSAGISFPSTGQAIVSVNTVNPYGCRSDTLDKLVEVIPLPIANAGPNVTFCTGSSAAIGGPANPGYPYYSWSPTTGLSDSLSSNPTVTLTNTGTTPITVTYVLTINENGCEDTDTVQVTVNPLPAVNAGPDKQVCENGTVGIGVTPVAGQTYSWTPSTGLSNSSISNPTVSAAGVTAPATLQYILLGQNSLGCQRRDTVNVTVNDVPVSNAGSDLNFCSGAGGTIGSSATTGYTYSWSPATGLSSTTNSNPTITLTNTTGAPVVQTYVVTTTLGSCTSTDTVQVTVRPNPVSNAGANQLLCSGSSVQIGSNPTTGYTYSWSPGTGLNNTTISNPTVTLTNNGTTTTTATYVVTTSLNGCNTSDTVVVTSAPQPTANAGPDVSICSGQTIAIGTAGTAGYTYSWSPASGLSNANTAVTNVTITNTGASPTNSTYVVNVNAFGCTDADTVVVEVRPAPVSNAGANQLLCSGSTVQIGSNPTTGYTYSWSPASGLNNTTISNPTVTLTNNGTTTTTATYVVSTTLNGCTTTDTVVVTSAPQPTANAGPDAIICSGQTANLGAAGTTGYTYSWSPSTGLSSANTATTTATLTNNGTAPVTNSYVVTVNAFGCLDTDTVSVEVRPAPIAEAGTNQLLCAGSTVQIGSASTPGYSYSWSPATGLNNTTISNPTLTLNNTGSTPTTVTYVVTVTLNGCTSVDSVTITSGPQPVANAGPDVFICSGQSISIGTPGTLGYTYSWSPSAGLSNTSAAVTNATGINTGTSPVNNTYIVNVNAFGCIDADTVVVQVRPNPVSNAGPNQLLCAGSTVQLGTSSTTGYTYSWSPATGLNNTTVSNPTLTLNNTGTTPTTATYIVTTTLNGCITTDTVVVTSAPQPTANAGPDVFICSGQSVSIGTAGTSGYTYSWSPASGLSNANNAVTNATGTNTGTAPVNNTYIVNVNAFGCVDADTVVVQVRPNPVSNAGPNQLLCAGSTVQLGTSSTTGYTYSWSPATGLNNTTVSNPTLTLNNTGTTPTTATYIVTTTLNGCITTDTVVVTSAPQPTANAGPDVFICSGQSVSIGTTGTTGYTYSWTPQAGLSNASSAVTNATGTNTGTSPISNTYIVSVNAFGCIDADTVVVEVRPNPIAQAGADATLCGGDTLVLGTSATAGYTYAWSPSTGLSSTNTSSPTLIVSNTGTNASTQTYAVTTTLNGCTTIDSVTITTNPQPIVLANGSQLAICDGDTTQLTASGATSYVWTWLNNTNVISQNDTINVHPSATQSYVVTGSNGFGCSNSDTITVTVSPIPAILATASNDTICSGDTLLLTGAGGSTYSWAVLGGSVVSTNNPATVTPNTNTTYILTGTSVDGCASTDTVSVVVNPGATAASILGNISVCPGVNGVSYWVPNANPNSTYTWSVNGGTIAAGQGSDSILVNWSSTSGTGIVTVIETTADGCQTPTPITLNVTINIVLTPAAPTGPQTLCALQAQGIVYTALNTPGSTYTWTAIGGTVVGGQGTNSVTVDWNVQGPQTVYLYYDENSTTSTNVCFGTSDSIAVTINPSPNTSAVTGDQDVCIGESAPYGVTSTNGSSYAWTVAGGNLTSGNGTATINSAFPQAGNATITVVETNSYGCPGETVVLAVVVHELPLANAGPDQSICIGQSTQLNASGGTAYQWSPATGLNNTGINNPVANPSATTSYIVQVTDQYGCKNNDTVQVAVNPLPTITVTPASSICIGGSIPLNATGGTTYAWTPAGSLSNANSSSPTASPSNSTVYTVVVTDQNGCVDSANVNITVNPLPVATANGDTTICNGSSVSLSAGGGTVYNWSPATGLNNPNISNPVATPASPTTYTVTVTDVNGCTDSEDVTISLNDVPVASFTIDENVTTATCNGIDAALINTSQNATNYFWTFPDGSTSTDVNPNISLGLSGTTITLVAQNNICYDTLTVNYNGPLLDVLFANLVNVFTPNGDGMNDCFELGANFNFDGCSAILILNRWGQPVFTSGSGKYCWNGKKENSGEELPAGTYYLTVTVAGASYKGTITLIR